MSLEAMRTAADANADAPDESLQRMLAIDIVAAVDELPIDKLDRKAKEIRFGSANVLREQPEGDKRDTAVVIVPIAYARHLLTLAGD